MRKLFLIFSFILACAVLERAQVSTKEVIKVTTDITGLSTCVTGKIYYNETSLVNWERNNSGVCAKITPGGTPGDVVGPASSTSGDVPTFNGAGGKTLQDSGKAFSTDGTFASNSDAKVPTEKAIKTYADTKQSALGFTPENSANKDAASGYAGLDGSTLLKAAEFPAFTGDATKPSGSLVTTVVKVNGNTPGGTCTNQFARSIDSSGRPTCASIVGGDLPNPSSSTLGGVQSAAAVLHQWIDSISTLGVPHLSQPAFSDISGTGTPSQVGLGNVTNDAQTKAAVVPNTAPAAGQILVGNAGGTAYAPVSASGDVTISSTGAHTIANNAVTLAKLATQATNTILGNATSGTAVPTALAIGTCSTSASALIWTTNTGFGCNTSVNAATLGGATFAAPGAIGGGTAAAGTFTTLAINQPADSSINTDGFRITRNGGTVYTQINNFNGITNFIAAFTGGGDNLMDFYTSDGTTPHRRMRIQASGGVSIGTTTDPGATNLQVAGTVTIGTFAASTSTTVCSNGGVLSTCTSLSKYKSDWQPIRNALGEVMKLRPIDYLSLTSHRRELGFLAEEVDKVDSRNSVYVDGKLIGVQYDHMVSLLTAAVQEQQAQIQKQQAQIDALMKLAIKPQATTCGDGQYVLIDVNNNGMRCSGGKPTLMYKVSGVNINSAASDVATISNLPSKYRVVRMMVTNPSTSLAVSAATLSLFTGTGGSGTAVVSGQLLTALSATTKFSDLTLALTTDTLTSSTLTVRNVLAHGSAATVDVYIEVLPLN